MQRKTIKAPEIPVEGTPRHFEPWEIRLKEEREQLLQRTLDLKAAFDNPDFKVNNNEWEMLRRQFSCMREYLQVLTDRCIYYGLIPAGDLNLHY